MQPDVENALFDVACNLDRDFFVVERVFHIMMGVHTFGHAIVVTKGELLVVEMPDSVGPLPTDLISDIEDSHDDVAELGSELINLSAPTIRY